MRTTDMQVRSLFDRDVQYIIPLFQRHYVWDKEDQWEPLWKDIVEKVRQNLSQSHNSHFTGAIVVHQKLTNLDEVPKYEIIDGQQRLTTFQIILCALRDRCLSLKAKVPECDAIARRADRYILNQDILPPSPVDEEYKLIPTESDKDSFQALVKGNTDQSSGKIKEVYDYFKQNIVNYVGNDCAKMLKLFHSILNSFSFVQILLDADDEPEKIFESLNARGKSLLQFDLLRNNLFLRAREDRDGLYTRYWQDFETPYWDPEVRSGTSSELFLQHFLMAKLGRARVKPEFNFYQRQYHRNLVDAQGVEYEFSELKRYAEVYQEMKDCQDDSEVGRRMKFYETFELTTLHPFLLFIICEVGLSGCELNYVFDILESYTIRRMLCCRGKAGLKNFNIFFSELIRELRNDFSLESFVSRMSEQNSDTRKYPTDDEVEPTLHIRYQEDPALFPDDSTIVFPGNRVVKAALHGLWSETAGQIKKKLIRYILYQIELVKRAEDRFAESLTFRDRLTLEHVMPNNWKETWRLPIVEGIVIYEHDSDGTPSVSVNREVGDESLLYAELFSDEYRENNRYLERPSRDGLADKSYADAFNLALVRDDLLQSIGNLTLVTPPLNSRLGNRTFPEKKEALNEHSSLRLNREICEYGDWSVNVIRERAEKLIAYFCKIWPSLDRFADNICRR